MDIKSLALSFSLLDAIAIAVTLAGWGLVGWLVERKNQKRPSVSLMMSEHRRAWMQQMTERDVRIFDAQVATSLRQGTAFLASTCILSIGGVVALMGTPDALIEAAESVGNMTPELVWQIKLLLVTFFLACGFLRFVWANRLFGYTMVLMAAVPNTNKSELSKFRAGQAAEMNIRAAINFNRGLRAVYFAIASLTWLAGSVALAIAALVAFWVIWHREFKSLPHKILSQPAPLD